MIVIWWAINFCWILKGQADGVAHLAAGNTEPVAPGQANLAEKVNLGTAKSSAQNKTNPPHFSQAGMPTLPHTVLVREDMPQPLQPIQKGKMSPQLSSEFRYLWISTDKSASSLPSS